MNISYRSPDWSNYSPQSSRHSHLLSIIQWKREYAKGTFLAKSAKTVRISPSQGSNQRDCFEHHVIGTNQHSSRRSREYR